MRFKKWRLKMKKRVKENKKLNDEIFKRPVNISSSQPVNEIKTSININSQKILNSSTKPPINSELRK